MLTGEPPFIANSTPAILVKHISERPIPVEQRRADVPQDLARVIMMLLEKDPANRLPSASAVVTALDTGKMPSVRAARAARSAPAFRPWHRCRRHSDGQLRPKQPLVRGDRIGHVRRTRAHAGRVASLGSAAGRQVPTQARAVSVRERRHRDRLDRRPERLLRHHGSLEHLPRVPSTRSSGPTATIGATCSASRAIAISSTSLTTR